MDCAVCHATGAGTGAFCGRCGHRLAAVPAAALLPKASDERLVTVLGFIVMLGTGASVYPSMSPAEAGGVTSEDRRVRDTIVAAIGAASQAETDAYLVGDLMPARATMSGDLLKGLGEAIAAANSAGRRTIQDLHARTIRSVKVETATGRAVVDMTETWEETEVSAQTGACIARFAPREIPQIVQMQQRGQRWIVVSAEFAGNQPPRRRAPCQR